MIAAQIPRQRSSLTLTSLLLLIFCLSHPAFAQSTNKPKEFPKATVGNIQSIENRDSGAADGLKVYALRLTPKQDLRKQLELFAQAHGLRAGFILTAVGSLQKVSLRLADQKDSTSFAGKYEIVSLVGTLSPDGVHLHLSVSDLTGKTLGGHLVEGCEIYTTAEIVVADARGLLFTREQDAQTGYKELRIRKDTRPHKRR